MKGREKEKRKIIPQKSLFARFIREISYFIRSRENYHCMILPSIEEYSTIYNVRIEAGYTDCIIYIYISINPVRPGVGQKRWNSGGKQSYLERPIIGIIGEWKRGSMPRDLAALDAFVRRGWLAVFVSPRPDCIPPETTNKWQTQRPYR